MSVTITGAPGEEPISTAEAKEWLRIDTTDTSQDAVLAIMITSCRKTIENHTRRKLITQQLTYVFSSHHNGYRIELPYLPASSVDSLTTYDENAAGVEVATVVDAANYQLVEGSYIVQRNDGWEINRVDRAGQVVYYAGYGASGSDVPGDLRHALLELLSLRFERRGDEDRDAVMSRQREILHGIQNYVLPI